MDQKTDLLPHEQPAPPRHDLWVAIVFFVFGTAAGWQALQMPTFTDQKGDIYTAPGLVPGFYSVVMVLLSLWLGARAIRQGALRVSAAEARPERDQSANTRLALAAGVCLVFIVGLIGRMPFWLAATVFVSTFTIIFEWQAAMPLPARARRIGEAVLLGLATGVAVTLVFERVFYVRLP